MLNEVSRCEWIVLIGGGKPLAWLIRGVCLRVVALATGMV